MRYAVIPVTPFQQNCTLAWCEASRKAVLVDPGGEPQRLLAAAHKHEVQVERLLLTHGHVDHAGAAGILADQLGVPIEGPHRDDAFLLNALPQQCQMFGFPPTDSFIPQRWLDDGDVVRFGTVELEVRHCPGHTPGHLVFFERTTRLAFVGDVLFHGSIGRTDFERGDHAALIASIRNKLWPLGDDVTFIPGHGQSSTFGRERRSNPFVADAVLGPP